MKSTARLALLWVAMLPLILAGCQKPEVFDVGLNSPAQVGYLDSVTVELITYVPPLDSLYTHNQSYLALGNYVDPHLGRISGEIYSQFSLGGEYVSFPDNATIDSVVLMLPLDSYYGKPSSTLQFEVNELTEALDGTGATLYFATSSVAYDATNLATGYSYAQASDQFAVDTLFIKLPNELGQRILDADINGPLANNVNFHQFFKGLRISTLPVNNADVGVIYTVAMRNLLLTSQRAASLRLYYSADGQVRTPYSLTVQAGVSQRFNKLHRSETESTLLENLVNRQQPASGQHAVLQSVVPVRVRGVLRNLPAQPLAINQAILELPVDTTFIDNNPYRHFRPIPSDLYFIPTDQDSITPDPYLGIETYANYNASTRRYEFNVSAYLHHVMRNPAANYGFIVMPPPFAYSTRVINGLATPSIGTTQRSILHNWQHANQKPRIRVHYTEIP